MFALGAGDIYVAFDKWTNHRRANIRKSTEDVAALALPEALSAMFLTTITTAIAFFASAICPVAPIQMFAIFCGLLIMWDYVLTVLFVFPALCIYDKALIKRVHRKRQGRDNCLWGSWLCCVSSGIICNTDVGGINNNHDGTERRGCKCCTKTNVYNNIDTEDDSIDNFDNEINTRLKTSRSTGDVSSEEDGSNNADYKQDHDSKKESNSTSQRFMIGIARLLFLCRWPLLVLCAVSFGLSGYFATTLKLPDSSDVRLLSPNNEFEQAFEWRKKLLVSDLANLSGSPAHIVWGLTPADTGDTSKSIKKDTHLISIFRVFLTKHIPLTYKVHFSLFHYCPITANPAAGTKLVLDEMFDPKSLLSQMYLKEFCDILFEQKFAWEPYKEYVCPINRFDKWLKEQSTTTETPDPDYVQYCGNANEIPVPEEDFHLCFSTWAINAKESSVVSRDGIVEVMYIKLQNSALFSDSYDVIDEQFNSLDTFMTTQNQRNAPGGVNRSYFSSATFYWHDTNRSMMITAYSGAGIALSASAVIILLSSKSVRMMTFATLTILFILTSVTSMLAAIGWTLGFIEAICFSILIGVSSDFVIHFAHAYTHQIGNLSRKERTKYAMVTMGPSILATALTTFCSAVVMLFCTITFFQKFALVLFFTIVMVRLLLNSLYPLIISRVNFLFH